MIDSHFNTTLHLMISLACLQEEDLNSENLAKNIGTNPAFVRKIMANSLRRARLKPDEAKLVA